MIRYIRGIYAMTFESGIIVEDGAGIGYEVFLPANSPLYRYGEGEEVKVFVHMSVKEDGVSLYGFHNRETQQLFDLLITVNGIGAKAAMSILSSLTSDELKRAIAFEDVKEISKANGVGKKTAERLILELKDKVGKFATSKDELDPRIVNNKPEASDGADNRVEAINALIALGYSKAEAFNAISMVGEESLSCEEYIKKALKNLF